MQETIKVRLPADCLREIFENLSQEKKSLRTFLLVNRLWCETVIPILWRDPFKLKRTYNSDPGFWTTITRTLLSCLSEESIILFKQNGIYPPMIPLEECKPTLFDYVGYCQNISCQDIYEIIPQIIGKEEILTNVSYYHKGNLVENELWKLFITRCSTIKYLELPNISLLDYYNHDLNNRGSCLSHLVELECSTSKSSQLFLDLAQTCSDIKKIVINLCDGDNEGLVTLISMQKYLKEIVLVSPEGVQCPLIGEAIGTQYPSLSSIRLEEHICIPSTILSKLINLKHLQIDLEEEINSKLELLDNCSFPLLETLVIRNVNGKYLDIYTKLINNTNGFLKIIEIDTLPIPSLYHIKPYWQALIKHCPQLEFVTVWYKDDSLNDLKKLLTTCGNKLKGIFFEAVLGQFSWRLLDLKCVFDLLIELIDSNNIEELHFRGSWTLHSKDLKNFLDNWGKKNGKGQKLIKKPLYISINVDLQLSKETINIFEEFVNNGVLKGWSRSGEVGEV
ncbi:hypothetical protein RhiirA5_494947 [Rhizophagus irregularis]|uniref:F-box domain-containing protein n=3 Tax=Rhizophagus irregularis TaxID=588596 RepID=A0A2I1DWJ3_9GLOM|nr:hypothetical protein RirG_041010 [Rhizophagus irregularis DAOM 197198w]PKC14966.1 hypothetical protein RhiirA5_494947 [Rhizophagus irregularis]GBC18773.1 hypothetical protein GLOIN_2v1499615 [Rhizophagus irregularis DAOM 181602=DAOM 197198]PKC70660.1 hypothetical protein RhiirA1_532549 [Rhizophagus irregularis]PKY14244.1 hypothetical protein RhiirB3_426210 [Rhizophagus irregularis]